MTLDSLVAFITRHITQAKKLIHKHPRLSLGAGVVLVLLVAMLSGVGGGTQEETVVVSPKPFVQKISVSGKVKAPEDVQMSFEQTGRVERIYVSVGQEVKEGAPLIALSSGTLGAELASAQAQLSLKRAERENDVANLENVRQQQNTAVESAYRTLLSSSLEAVPFSGAYSSDAPVITGAYTGTKEGQYKFSITEKNLGAGDYELRVIGLETPEAIRVSKTGPTPLGSLGLYVSFPDPVASYKDTIWYVSLPNTKATTYVTNYNAYQEALRERDKAVADAEAALALRLGTTIKDAEVAAAQAEVNRILAELAKFTLRAPFDGVVTAIDAEVGEAVSVNDSAVSLIGARALEIESFVPEINIAYLAVGDPAVVTLDAYGEQVPFTAKVIAIDPAETIRDGVSTYRVRLAFMEDDERVKSGMTANILITTDERDGVISVPQGVIVKKKDISYVPVKEGGRTTLTPVITGAVSSLGEIEVVSGLEEGDIVVLSKKK